MDDALESHKEYPVVDINSTNDLVVHLMTLEAAILIVSLETRSDLLQVASFMKVVKKIAKDKPLKVVVINFSANKTFELAVNKIGILDIVQADINAKAFKFKLDFWIRSFQAQLKTSQALNTPKTKKSEAEATAGTSPNTPSIDWQNPLDLEDDIWLVENETDCRKVLTKWLISTLGPSPFAGEWKEIKKNLWKFEMTHANKDLFISGSGFWFFQGDIKPDFSWKENNWLFSGDQVSLYFQDPKQTVYRFQSKEKTLSICKNSLYAKTKEEIIRETFNNDIHLKSEAQILKNLSGDTATDHLRRDDLTGKGSTDKITNKNLSGSVWGKEEAQKGHETMSQSTSKESSYLEGKIFGLANKAADENGASVSTERHNEGKNLDMARSDMEHEKYYRNHNLSTTYDSHQWKEHNQSGSPQKSENPFFDVNAENPNGRDGRFSEEKKDSSSRIETEAQLESVTNDSKVICFLKQNPVQLECVLDDFFDGNIMFVSKENSLINNKTVHMNMTFKSGTKDTFLNISGMVSSIEEDGEGSYYINVQVTKEDSKSFAAFVRLYSLRQSNVNEFLKFAKGM